MQEYLTKQREAFALVNKEPGQSPLKTKIVEELTSQINHLFSHNQFKMNIFFGQPGMGKRSSVNAAIEKSKYCDTIFYLEIDAEFTRTEYLLLNKIFNLIKAEDPFFKQFNRRADERKRKSRRGDYNKSLNVGSRRDHAYNFLNKNFQLDRKQREFNDGVSEEMMKKYKPEVREEEEGSFKELDEQDALSMYSTLHDYFSFFNIVLYLNFLIKTNEE